MVKNMIRKILTILLLAVGLQIHAQSVSQIKAEKLFHFPSTRLEQKTTHFLFQPFLVVVGDITKIKTINLLAI